MRKTVVYPEGQLQQAASFRNLNTSKQQSSQDGAEDAAAHIWNDDELELDSLMIQHESSSVLSMLEKTVSQCKEGLNGVLFTMSKKSITSFWLVVLGMFIDFLQLSAFALPERELLDYGFPPAIEQISQVLSYAQFGYQLTSAFGVFYVLIVFLCLVVLEMLNLLYVGYAWTKKDFKHLWTIKVLRATISLFVGIFFIPILGVFSKVFTCSGLDAQSCAVLLPITAVVMTCFVILGFVLSVSYFDPRPSSDSPAARPHSRLSTLHLLMKTVFTIAFSLLRSAQPTQMMKQYWSLFVCISSFCVALLFIWYQPYFHRNICTIRGILSSLLPWFGLCAYFQTFLMATETEMLVPVFVAGVLLIIPLAWLAVICRRHMLLFMPINQCRSAFEVELKCRFYIQGYGTEYLSSLSKADPDLLRERAAVVHKWYIAALSHFPTSSALCVFHAHVLLDFMSSKSSILVRRAVVLAERQGVGLDLSFNIYKTKQLLEENADTSDVMAYVKSEKYLNEALNMDKSCCIQLIQFWNELSRRHPDINKVRNLALSIGKSSAAAKAAYVQLLGVSQQSHKTLQLFGTFLTDVINDTKAGQQLLMRAANSKRKEKAKAAHLQSLDDIQSGLVGVLLVNLEDSSGGEEGAILTANPLASQLLNQASKTLVNRPVFSLLVQPTDEALQHAMDMFLKEGEDQFFDETLETFMLSTDGSCFPVSLKLKPFAVGGVNFRIYLSFMRALEQPSERLYLILDSSKHICGISRALGSFVGELEGLADGSTTVTVDRIIPGFVSKGHLILGKGEKHELEIFQLNSANSDFANHDDNSEVSSFFGEVRSEKRSFMNAEYVQLFIEPNEDCEVEWPTDEMMDDFLSESEDDLELIGPAGKRDMLDFDDGADQSVADGEGESTTSSQQIQRKAANIRKILHNQQESSMDSTLVSLRRMYLLVSIVVCAVVMNQYIQGTDMLVNFSASVALLNRLGFRRFCMVTIADTAHLLNMIHTGVLDSGEDAVRSEMVWAANTLKSIDTILFGVRQKHPGLISTLYSEEHTPYLYLRNGRLVVDRMSAYEATLKITSLASQAAQMSRETFTEDNSVYFSLMNNLVYANNSILETLDRSTQSFQFNTYNSLTSVISEQRTISLSLAAVVAVLILIACRPLVGNSSNIERSTHEVLDVFLKIPKKVTSKLAERYIQRLHEVHENSTDYEDDAGSGDDMSQQRKGSVHSLVKSGRRTSIADIPTPKGPLPPLKLPGQKGVQFAEESPNENRKAKLKKVKKKQNSRFSWFSWRKFVIVIKISSLLILSVSYFTTTTVYMAQLSKSLESAPATANFAGYRRMKTRDIQHSLRRWLTSSFRNITYADPETGEALSFTRNAEDVRYRIEELLAAHNKLLYGSKVDGLVGVFKEKRDSSTDTQMRLYTADGCIGFKPKGNLTADTCRAFMHGILANGLHSTLESYVEKIFSLTNEEGFMRAAELFNRTLIRNELSRPDLVDYFQLEKLYFQPQLTISILTYAAEVKAKVATARSFTLTLAVCFIFGVALIYLVVIRTLLRQLDTEVKRTRSLLLIIPEDMLESLKHVQKFIVSNFSK